MVVVIYDQAFHYKVNNIVKMETDILKAGASRVLSGTVHPRE